MWLQIFVCIALAQNCVLNLENQIPNKTNQQTRESEAIFSDVIKNISRVNYVLQDLIKNYERLQNLYKSQESLNSETSDEEIDEIFKSKDQKGKKKNKNESLNTPPPDGIRATQMIWSDADNNYDNDEVISTESDESNIANENVNQAENDASIPESPGVQSNSNSEKVVIELYNKQNTEKKPVQNAQIIFIDTHTTTTTSKVIMIESSKERLGLPLETTNLPFSKVHKTRYNKVSSHSNNKNNKKQNKKKIPRKLPKVDIEKSNLDVLDNITETRFSKIRKLSKAVKNNMHSASFSPRSIWDEIINKPIQVQTHNEFSIDMRRYNNDDPNSLKRAFKGEKKDEKPKTKSMIVRKKNKKKKRNRSLRKNKNTRKGSDSEKDDRNEEFKASVLREAYGDACLKVVVKKCYKACVSANKEVCDRFKCHSDMKDAFKRNSRTGCIYAFEGKTTDANEAHEDKIDDEIGNEAHAVDIDDENDNKAHEDNIDDVNASKAQDDNINDENGNEAAKVDDDVEPTLLRVGNNTRNVIKKNIAEKVDKNKRVSGIKNTITSEGYLLSCLPHLHTYSRRSIGVNMLLGNPGLHINNVEEPRTILDASSSPYLSSVSKVTGSNKNQPLATNETLLKQAKTTLQLNILRDRYEKECQKISAAKCRKACEFAIEYTCSQFQCAAGKKKAYTKACRNKCKVAYKGSHSYKSSRNHKSSSSTSSTSSESSDSDDSSDS